MPRTSFAKPCGAWGMSIKSVLWKPHEKAKAIQMAHAGKSMRDIAAAVGRSRNSVIGFLHRSNVILNKIPKPVDNSPRKPKPRRVRTVYKPPVTYLAPEPFEESRVLFFDTKRFECKWIFDKPLNVWQTTACGQPIHKGSYCEHHYNIVYQREGQTNVRQAS